MSLIEDERDIPARWHEDLARTGPETPGGRFMRRFWMPVMRAEDLPAGQAKPIRVMSEGSRSTAAKAARRR